MIISSTELRKLYMTNESEIVPPSSVEGLRGTYVRICNPFELQHR